jgi:hypothetical protein
MKALLLVTWGAIVAPAAAQVVQPRTTAGATITVTSPKAGDRLLLDRTAPIRWSSVRLPYGATASMGNTPVQTAVSYSGLGGFIRLPYSALTDYFVFTKGTATARSPQPLKVVPAPRFANDSTPWGVTLNVEHQITAWDLTPGSSVSGLAYEFRLAVGQEFTACHLQYVLVSQTTNAIRFRVDTTSAIPAVCLTSGLFQEHASAYHVMQLIGKYAGVEKELWRRPFYLIAP